MVKVECCELIQNVIVERKSATIVAKENISDYSQKNANKREDQIKCLGNSGSTNITKKILSLFKTITK
jgi:hypothetical protein